MSVEALKAEFLAPVQFSPRSETKEFEDKPKISSPYNKFLTKYDDLENTIDKLSNRDLVYYFRETAKDAGVKVSLPEMAKNIAIIKKLRNDFSQREICGMMEFLFHSNQDMLNKNSIGVGIFSTNWLNSIYSNSQLWIEGKYIPKKETKFKGEHVNASASKSGVGAW